MAKTPWWKSVAATQGISKLLIFTPSRCFHISMTHSCLSACRDIGWESNVLGCNEACCVTLSMIQHLKLDNSQEREAEEHTLTHCSEFFFNLPGIWLTCYFHVEFNLMPFHRFDLNVVLCSFSNSNEKELGRSRIREPLCFAFPFPYNFHI